VKAFNERFQGPVVPSRDDINRILNTISRYKKKKKKKKKKIKKKKKKKKKKKR